jgi:hypothetical protein
MSFTFLVVLSVVIAALLAAFSREGTRFITFIKVFWALLVISFVIYEFWLIKDTHNIVQQMQLQQTLNQ